jgi:hypothetical protein
LGTLRVSGERQGEESQLQHSEATVRGREARVPQVDRRGELAESRLILSRTQELRRTANWRFGLKSIPGLVAAFALTLVGLLGARHVVSTRGLTYLGTLVVFLLPAGAAFGWVQKAISDWRKDLGSATSRAREEIDRSLRA